MSGPDDRQSEWGALNAGRSFTVLTIDLDRAIACARLGDYEAILLQHVREGSWGRSTRRKRRGEPWPDPIPFTPDLAALARSLGVPHQRLYEARTRLIASRILVPDAEGLLINKRADQWLALDGKGQPTGPRLNPLRVQYCFQDGQPEPTVHSRPSVQPREDGDGRAFTPEREVHSRQTVNATPVVHSRPSVQEEPSAFTPDRECKGRAFTPEREVHSRQSVNGHTKDPARLDPEEEEKRGPRPRLGAHPDAGTGAGAPACEAEAAIHPGDPRHPENRRLSMLADDLSGGTLGGWVSAALKLDYPPHHVQAVIEKKVAGARPMPSPGLLMAILQRWARGEGSDIPPDPGAKAPGREPPKLYKPRRPVHPAPRRSFDP